MPSGTKIPVSSRIAVVTSPMRIWPSSTLRPAATVIAARPTLRISAWAAFSSDSEVLAFTEASA